MQHKTAYIWGLLSRFAPQFIYLVTTMILARFLTPDDFGKIGVLSIIFLVANVLLDSGLGGSLVKEKKISEIDCSTIFVFNIIVSVSIYILLFFSAGKLEDYFGIKSLEWVVKSISLVFPFSAIGIVPKAILNRNLRFKETCFNSVIGVIAASFLSIVSATLNAGVYSLVVYQVVCVGVSSILNCISSNYRISFRFSGDSFIRLIPFGVATTIITVIDTIYENVMTTMTGKFMNVQQAGYLYQAKRIEETLSTSLATTIGAVAFPVLTKLKDDRERFVLESDTTFITISSFSVPLLIIIAIFSNEIIMLLFGEQWIEAGNYLKLLVFAGIFLIMETLIRNFIKALCEVKKLLYATFIKRVIGISILIASFIFNPSYMLYAYILSTIIGYLINVTLYSKIIRCKVVYQIRLCFLSLYPGALFYFIMEYLICCDNFFIKIFISALLLILIYAVILPIQGLNVFGLVRNILKRK